jgi:ergothioneine biosynthesis protein EgtB
MSSVFDAEPVAPQRDRFNAIAIEQQDSESLLQSYIDVREASERFAGRFSPEDQNLQSMPDASPLKWHRAHTSWFFETFLLGPHQAGYRSPDPTFNHLFNSYYNGIGEQYPRTRRGLISRPDSEAISAYRRHVDAAMLALVSNADASLLEQLRPLILLGLNHEQQHQELMVTDIKHGLSFNPSHPAWAPAASPAAAAAPMTWTEHEGGLCEFGHCGSQFCFDNETPRHRVHLQDFELADRPVSAGEYLAFMDDDGYSRPEFWLSDGWAWRQQQSVHAPLYWWLEDGQWLQYSASGARLVDPNVPVCHVSFYEAHAFSQWSGARLPLEHEWELAASSHPLEGHFADRGLFHPTGENPVEGPGQMFGTVWEWTASSYAPYPRFKVVEGAVGEYNGKFMANQMVLRGGSCATPPGHVRSTYRNFFYPGDRWQFSGIRLARDCR